MLSVHHPVHVTLRGAKGMPSFRTQQLYAAFYDAVKGTRREDFRITEFSVQDDHVHAIVEADDARALSRGMRSFTVRAVRRVNKALRRKSGPIWGDRYHRHDLTTPSEVRNALVYVLQNYKKHYGVTHGRPRIDLCSSAQWFTGWIQHRPLPPGDPPVEKAASWLLRVGWHTRGGGFIHPGEAPRTASRVSSGSSSRCVKIPRFRGHAEWREDARGVFHGEEEAKGVHAGVQG